ncbi:MULTISPECIES: helix-turn-helix domain-containing protein [Clostridium]|uniref:helix-turn-helix domain-containing protein n=1 Tax=Clostridium TaxID=1485 RepID=UPI0008252365|nr:MULTISPECIES: helix-turn-helix domain-containing protein [Clostridium]PJI09512.1 helix-turn-helix domain-containing protein [Clostridium sp. CT7]
MVELQRSYYAIIPANIRYDRRITPNAKLLYGEITALTNEKGYCWASNAYFAELYNVSKTSISKWIKQLIDCEYLKSVVIYKEGTKEILNRYLTILIGGIEEKLHTPIEEKLKDNTTLINNTINNTNKKKKSLDDLINGYTDNKELIETLEDFLKMRKSIKKPLTNRGMELLLRKLDSLSENDNEKVEILNQSIFNSWQGIFPLKRGSEYGTRRNIKKGNENSKKVEYDFSKYGG